MVFAYENSVGEEAWRKLVGAASFVNQSKWGLCRCTLTVLSLEAAALGLTYLLFPGNNPDVTGRE